MTFRIDGVQKGSTGAWQCHFKGARGHGLYGSLMTDANGRGLYLSEHPGESVELLPPARFHIPSVFPPAWARERFAAALWIIEWGGEIREYGPGKERSND
jgi:hypothetical protein